MSKKLSQKQRGEVDFKEKIYNIFVKYTAIIMDNHYDNLRLVVDAFDKRFERIEKKLGLKSYPTKIVRLSRFGLESTYLKKGDPESSSG